MTRVSKTFDQTPSTQNFFKKNFFFKFIGSFQLFFKHNVKKICYCYDAIMKLTIKSNFKKSKNTFFFNLFEIEQILSITLGNKFLFIYFFLVFPNVFGVADANFDVSFCILSTVLNYLQEIEILIYQILIQF